LSRFEVALSCRVLIVSIEENEKGRRDLQVLAHLQAHAGTYATYTHSQPTVTATLEYYTIHQGCCVGFILLHF
ncbi:hypothetical protein, partial [Paenibacillus sp. SI8]|uniref:hypothetical protein n=1 Tax=unclassified Paenibacillus TaxID=185978 RepID=UPI003467842C